MTALCFVLALQMMQAARRRQVRMRYAGVSVLIKEPNEKRGKNANEETNGSLEAYI